MKPPTLTMMSWNLRQIEDEDIRNVYIQGVKFACAKAGVVLVLHRSDGLKLSDEDEALFDEVYCGHDRKVVKERETAVVSPPLRRRRPV